MNKDMDVKTLHWSKMSKKRSGHVRRIDRDMALDSAYTDTRHMEEGSLDPRMVRFIVTLCLWGVSLLLAVVYLQNEKVRLNYRAREMSQISADLSEENQELEVEVAKLEGFPFVESKARELGLVPVRPCEVHFVHEVLPQETKAELVGDTAELDALDRMAIRIKELPFVREGSG